MRQHEADAMGEAIIFKLEFVARVKGNREEIEVSPSQLASHPRKRHTSKEKKHLTGEPTHLAHSMQCSVREGKFLRVHMGIASSTWSFGPSA